MGLVITDSSQIVGISKPFHQHHICFGATTLLAPLIVAPRHHSSEHHFIVGASGAALLEPPKKPPYNQDHCCIYLLNLSLSTFCLPTVNCPSRTWRSPEEAKTSTIFPTIFPTISWPQLVDTSPEGQSEKTEQWNIGGCTCGSYVAFIPILELFFPSYVAWFHRSFINVLPVTIETRMHYLFFVRFKQHLPPMMNKHLKKW